MGLVSLKATVTLGFPDERTESLVYDVAPSIRVSISDESWEEVRELLTL